MILYIIQPSLVVRMEIKLLPPFYILSGAWKSNLRILSFLKLFSLLSLFFCVSYPVCSTWSHSNCFPQTSDGPWLSLQTYEYMIRLISIISVGIL